MSQSSTHEVTSLPIDGSKGDKAAPDKLTPLISEELRRLARHDMSRERRDHTPQTTVPANEAIPAR